MSESTSSGPRNLDQYPDAASALSLQIPTRGTAAGGFTARATTSCPPSSAHTVASEVGRRRPPRTFQYAPMPVAVMSEVWKCPRFVAARDAATGEGPLCFWLPLSVALTGARASQLVRTKVTDLAQCGDHWILRLPARARVSRSSRWCPGHWIPLHDELVRCGFIDYAEQRKLDGHEGLFLSEDSDAAASRGLAVARRWLSRVCLRPCSTGS